jgi:hypothetical protein
MEADFKQIFNTPGTTRQKFLKTINGHTGISDLIL